jgi:hypothetical protein
LQHDRKDRLIDRQTAGASRVRFFWPDSIFGAVVYFRGHDPLSGLVRLAVVVLFRPVILFQAKVFFLRQSFLSHPIQVILGEVADGIGAPLDASLRLRAGFDFAPVFLTA